MSTLIPASNSNLPDRSAWEITITHNKKTSMKTSQHTFVILAYGESPYLETCMQSLLTQTMQSDILISTSTPSNFIDALAQKYSLSVMINPNRESIAADWSYAYHAAQTPYVTLAHQDDCYFSEYTAQCLTMAQLYPDNLILFTRYRELVGKTYRRSALITIKQALLWPFLVTTALHSSRFKKMCISFGNPIPCPSVMYHKEAVGEFEFSKEWQFNLDWEAWLRLAERVGCFVYVKKPLMAHRLHEDSETSRLIRNRKRAEEELYMLQQLWKSPWATMLAKVYHLGAKLNRI